MYCYKTSSKCTLVNSCSSRTTLARIHRDTTSIPSSMQRYLTHTSTPLPVSLHYIIFYIGISDKWNPPDKYTPACEFIAANTTTATHPQALVKSKLLKTGTDPPPIQPILSKYTTTIPTALTLQEKIKNESVAFNDPILFPPELPIKEAVGKSKLMCPQKPYAQDHNAIPLLNAYAAEGCPVDCGDDWTMQQVELLLKKGPHQSAKCKNAIKQLRAETTDKIEHGYARVVRWEDIKHNMPPKLKISPVAMIPHKSKAFRCILDLSFTLHHRGNTYPSVNDSTIKHSKAESMIQLGLALQRIVAAMADEWKRTDGRSTWNFAKLDIKDGFWRMAVNDNDAWNFCYVLPSLKPSTNLGDTEIVVPNSLQMGWCESPPFFCSGTETARDIIQRLLEDKSLPAHPFEDIMLKKAAQHYTTTTNTDSKTIVEVFVDDFIAATTSSCTNTLRQISRALIQGIHSIFPPPSVTGHNGFDPISEGKLEKGEGTWDNEKEILGWIFNGSENTITLPPTKCTDIVNNIKKVRKTKRVSLNKFQKLAGRLQHASFGIPGGAGLFSPIQQAMKMNPPFINISAELDQALQDWRYMINHLKHHPTHVSQLVHDYPHYLGYSDACGLGAGGVWCSGTHSLQPTVWQVQWPQAIKAKLITDKNPSGSLTINDLELAGIVLHWLVLEWMQIPLKYCHIGTFCDNVSATVWAHRLRTSTSIPAARLLRLLGIRIHAQQASGLTPLSIAGVNNNMADIASRAFKNGKYFAAAHNLTTYFNTNFPLQATSWTECHLPKEIISRVISCLQEQQLPMESLIRLPKLDKNIGTIGKPTHPSSTLIRSYKGQPSQTSTKKSSSAPLLQGSGQGLTEKDFKLKFKESRTRLRPSPRPYSWLENKVPSTKMRNPTK